ncbi:lipoprotein LppI [Mycobacterium triplex]|nr:lipoprotein LppI [Mycobacterium triplex]
MAVLVTLSVLVAGCSHHDGGQSANTTAVSGYSPTTTVSPGGKPPAAGAPISDVVAWIEAGHPADPARYHTVSRDGVTTQLGNDVAFAVPAAKVACMTDSAHTGGTLTCLVDLADPPPRPDTAYGQWKGGWVTFDGTNLQVGAARADPGPFVNGNGAELAAGDTLSYDDYRCRADQAGLFCVNYARQSAARFSGAGIQQFGCLRSVPPPDGIGIAFGC